MKYITILLFVASHCLSQAQGINTSLGGNGLGQYRLGDGGIEQPTDANPIPTLPTENLYAYWDYSDLTDGDVGTWTASQGEPSELKATIGEDPVKNSTGVIFGGADALGNGTALDFGFDNFSVHFVLKIVDTSFKNPPPNVWYMMCKNRNSVVNMVLFYEGFGDNRFQVLCDDGSGVWSQSAYYNTSIIPLNKYTLYSIVYDASTGASFYINGVLQSGTIAASSGSSDDGIRIGEKFSRYVQNGTGYRQIIVYGNNDSESKVQEIYNYLNVVKLSIDH